MNSTSISAPAQSISLPDTDGRQQERRARRFWVSVIVGLLSLQVFGAGIAIYLALSDSTVAIIPNYYQAGLQWDTTRQHWQRFEDLAWSIDTVVSAHDTQLPRRVITLRVRDGHGQPVSDQRITGQVFHHARGNQVYWLTFDQADAGDYVAMVPLTHNGLWQFDVAIEGDQGIAAQRWTVMVQSDGVEQQE
ncbi:MAG: FixH family protein [Pirellulaceae bacterium]|nr:FixH family protein [Pirellulaceae bacterium]